MRIDKKKAVTLSALTLLITSLLLINMNGPTSAQLPSQPIYLHGPSLTPIHLNSNKTLTPIHMHLVTPPDILQWDSPELYEPNCTTDWVKIYPDYDPEYVYHLSSWEDNGDQKLSPNDQIDMTDPDGNVTWYHVDRMTVTLLLSNLTGPPDPAEWPGPAEPTLAVELKWPTYWPEIKYEYNLPPQGPPTSWHEVWPYYSNTYNLTSFSQSPFDPTPWRINPCDVVDLTNSSGFTTWWHVESVSTDLILREKIMDPKGTWWHEIYPEYCNWYNITSWESYPDPYCDRLSPNDQIDMTDLDGNVTWYNVDRVTVTLNVTDRTPESDPTKWMKIELKTPSYEEIFEAFKHPNCTLWHEVFPNYCNVYNLTRWHFWLDDNCNGVLDVCDYIWLLNMTAGDQPGSEERWHVEDITYDLILNRKIDDPAITDWHELYPNFSNWYEVINWTDNSDDLLSPSDYIGLHNVSDGTDANYHVDNVTLTMHVVSLSWDFYIELNATFEDIYKAKIEPLNTSWYNVYPYYDESYNLSDWWDNCNGVLDYCDYIELSDPTIQWSDTFHIEELALDIIVSTGAPPPPPSWYKKPPYFDYAPSGMPDFDQKQDLWSHPQAGWTWCGPTAVANSLWWFDSKYDPSNIVPAFPGVNDDHHVLNVDPLVKNLSYWMDTDGQRTGVIHTGTYWQDMQWGIEQYLQQQGITTLEVHNKSFPEFNWIEDEIYACQDVVLLLEFWWWNPTGGWERVVDPYDLPGGESGHYVTCAGVNSSIFELLICDPWWDAVEAGLPGDIPVPHPPHGDPTVHNDTQYVSHDAYIVTQWMGPQPGPYGGQPIEELVNYLQQLGYGPNYHTFIKVAVVTSPLAEHDVAVIDVSTSKTGCLPMETVGENRSATMNVTVENQGGSMETFNVTVYANTTVIKKQLIPNLPAGNTASFTFSWNTTGFAKGNYTISAVADTVLGETDTADNTFTYGDILVTLVGDANGDQWVDWKDLLLRLIPAYNSNGGPPPTLSWDPNCDFNDDNWVDWKDLLLELVPNYNQHWP